MIERGFASYLPWRAAIAEMLDPRRHTIEWLDGQVMTGLASVWTTPDAAIVTEIRSYPTGARDIHGLAAVGSLDAVRDVLIPAAEEYGRSIGCLGAVIESRPGWKRALASSGYEVRQVALGKEF